jgi:hypothetical protein
MNRNWALVPAAFAGALVAAQPALASEGGTSFYLLGSKTTMAGYLPPTGVYASVQNYFYTGSADIDFQTAGIRISGGIDADAFASLPTALWVTDAQLLGGNLALSLTTPVLGKQMEAGVLFDRLGVQADISRDNWAFGDPVLGATLGWHDGKLHYTLGTLVNVPLGQWEFGSPVNAGFNHWAVDATGAVTYLDPATGVELSGATGLTFNFENPDTDYTTGTELHVEAAVMKHVSQTLSFGLNGYAYKQLTGDSGSGAKLGDFKGQVFGVGPALDFTFHLGRLPVATNLRYFYEFGAENRLEGHAAYVNFAIPLGGQAPHGQ